MAGPTFWQAELCFSSLFSFRINHIVWLFGSCQWWLVVKPRTASGFPATEYQNILDEIGRLLLKGGFCSQYAKPMRPLTRRRLAHGKCRFFSIHPLTALAIVEIITLDKDNTFIVAVTTSHLEQTPIKVSQEDGIEWLNIIRTSNWQY
jgi:hypothetical protein